MAATELSEDIKAAAIAGAIEILINPEFGTDWIQNEVLRDIPDEEVNEDVAGQVSDIIMERFKDFALTLASELPAEKRAVYETVLNS